MARKAVKAASGKSEEDGDEGARRGGKTRAGEIQGPIQFEPAEGDQVEGCPIESIQIESGEIKIHGPQAGRADETAASDRSLLLADAERAERYRSCWRNAACLTT